MRKKIFIMKNEKKIGANRMGYCPTVLQGESFVLQYIQCIASWKGLFRLRKCIAVGLVYIAISEQWCHCIAMG